MSANPNGARMQQASGADVNYLTSPNDPGEPTNVSTYTYAGGSKWGVQWTNAGAFTTQISLDGGATVDAEEAKGVTSREGYYTPIPAEVAVRHRDRTKYSAWVSANEV